MFLVKLFSGISVSVGMGGIRSGNENLSVRVRLKSCTNIVITIHYLHKDKNIKQANSCFYKLPGKPN